MVIRQLLAYNPKTSQGADKTILLRNQAPTGSDIGESKDKSAKREKVGLTLS